MPHSRVGGQLCSPAKSAPLPFFDQQVHSRGSELWYQVHAILLWGVNSPFWNNVSKVDRKNAQS